MIRNEKDALAQIARGKPIPADVVIFAKNSPTVKSAVVLACEPIIHKILHRYNITEYEDYLQDGFIGLIHAVDNFNPSIGVQFSTFATSTVRGHILRAMYQKLPVSHYFVSTVKAVQNYLKECPGAGIAEIAEATETSELDVHFALNALAINLPVSSFAPMSKDEEDGGTVGDFIEDENSNVEENVLKQFAKEQVCEAFSKIFGTDYPDEWKVVKANFGLGCIPMSTPEICKCFGISQEDVRKSRTLFFRKMRNPKNLIKLKEILGVPKEISFAQIPDYIFS